MSKYDVDVNGKWILDIREVQDDVWIGSYHDTKELAIEKGYKIAEEE